MTYTESIKSGHIAVWNQCSSAMSFTEAERHCLFMVSLNHKDVVNFHTKSDIYAVNAINKMIDSARDL